MLIRLIFIVSLSIPVLSCGGRIVIPDNIPHLPTVFWESEAKGGFYNNFEFQTWEEDAPACISLSIINPFKHHKFGPGVGVRLEDEKGRNHVLFRAYQPTRADVNDQYFKYSIRIENAEEPTKKLFKQRYKIGSEIFFGLSISDDNVVSLSYNNETYLIPLQFEPNRMIFNQNSSRSAIRYYSDCTMKFGP